VRQREKETERNITELNVNWTQCRSFEKGLTGTSKTEPNYNQVHLITQKKSKHPLIKTTNVRTKNLNLIKVEIKISFMGILWHPVRNVLGLFYTPGTHSATKSQTN